jgi:amino acid transporter
MADKSNGHGFGTAPVFLAAISTILGAILFLRFGYAVGNLGLWGTLMVIILGHAVTIPTGLAIAEIATNLKVKGGGEYFIISRSFGLSIGGAIGLALAISQIISIAFYMIAFSEAFTPLFPYIQQKFGFVPDVRMISLPSAILLILFMLTKGANLGVKILWVVTAVLAVSLLLFFMGGTGPSGEAHINLFDKIQDGDGFFIVFAIIFPGFTGMTAGVGLSGDLKDPGKSIPLGTLAATLSGMVIYVLVIVKLYFNATPEELVNNQLIMSNIAVWGPIIPIGLGAASLSSAIGSILIAPRTLQAIASDKIFPFTRLNNILSSGRGETNEPVKALFFVSVIAIIFIAMGDINFVAKLISMFFMTTYGALCAISFLEHFAGNPSYRPTFRSKWYLSLIGAILSVLIMLQMQPVYALASFLLLYLTYRGIHTKNKDKQDLSTMFQNVLFQLTRQLHLEIQKRHETLPSLNWRPSIITISNNTHKRLDVFSLTTWISDYYGFGTYYAYIKGMLEKENIRKVDAVKVELLKIVKSSNSSVFVNTVISPSFISALAQIIQISGFSGLKNNTLLLEFQQGSKGEIDEVMIGCNMAEIVNFNLLILRTSGHNFGFKSTLDVWITNKDYNNANLMILLSYIIKGYKDWKNTQIKIYVAFKKEEMKDEYTTLSKLINDGRLPISKQNIIPLPYKDQLENLIHAKSQFTDLVIMGFDRELVLQGDNTVFEQFPDIRDLLFVNAKEEIGIH